MKDKIKEIMRERVVILKEVEEGRTSVDFWDKLKSLEVEHKQHLLIEEQSWRLKSRAVWLKTGDKNTKFFHKFAFGRRSANAIWHIEENGNTIHSTENIKTATVNFFGELYERKDVVGIEAQLEFIDQYPRMMEEEDLNKMKERVGPDEIRGVLKSFVADKSPGPDGWTPDFFLHFYEDFIMEITDMVEEARLTGRIHGAIKSTFLILIRKNKGKLSFNDYRRISLCNTLYKIISKLIADRLKVVLSKHITPEQTRFLKHMSIHDVVALTQEINHSIQSRGMKAAVMKIDLNKAYDKVDWDFLRLVLFKIGLDRGMVGWIMGCITHTSMAVIINGSTMSFFHPGRGLRQGCTLSPLLFILIMDSLSIKIKRATDMRIFRGIDISPQKEVSHSLFVDDVLIFGIMLKRSWMELKGILNGFCLSTGMMVSEGKSCIYHAEGDEEDYKEMGDLFNYNIAPLSEGLTYLGFRLKPLRSGNG